MSSFSPASFGFIARSNASIDGSIREAVNAFALAQAALHERFIAALTHDLRNPLSNAQLAAQLIEQAADSDRIKEFAEQIVASLKRMDGMIQDLLDSVRFQAGERLRLRFEEFDMQEVVKEVCGQFAFVHGPRFQLIAPKPGATGIGRPSQGRSKILLAMP